MYKNQKSEFENFFWHTQPKSTRMTSFSFLSAFWTHGFPLRKILLWFWFGLCLAFLLLCTDFFLLRLHISIRFLVISNIVFNSEKGLVYHDTLYFHLSKKHILLRLKYRDSGDITTLQYDKIGYPNRPFSKKKWHVLSTLKSLILPKKFLCKNRTF